MSNIVPGSGTAVLVKSAVVTLALKAPVAVLIVAADAEMLVLTKSNPGGGALK